MEASGIIRRVDSLGRIVIPKELRQTLGIHTGDSLEVGVNEQNQIVLSKHSWLKELEVPSRDLCRTLLRTCGRAAAVADREHILASAGFRDQRISGEPISTMLRRLIEARAPFRAVDRPVIYLTDRSQDSMVVQAVPIIVHGEASGCIVLAGSVNQTEQLTPEELDCNEKVLIALTAVIGSYLSD